uniref:Uncharacterized protein n=1 Tax=Anguilla anguilla TaxID=7936 RepID=A0A0E9V869_ANGAN
MIQFRYTPVVQNRHTTYSVQTLPTDTVHTHTALSSTDTPPTNPVQIYPL